MIIKEIWKQGRLSLWLEKFSSWFTFGIILTTQNLSVTIFGFGLSFNIEKEIKNET